MKFIPFVLFAFIDILINIIMAFTGISIARIDNQNEILEEVM